MTELVYNPTTEQEVQAFIKNPSHALLLSGPAGSGKFSIAYQVAAELLAIEVNRLDQYPFFQLIQPDNGSIKIESIRQIDKFLLLKVPAKHQINRIILINDSDSMGIEAQNALLKQLEEPPSGTIFILTNINNRHLLPTILSRVSQIQIRKPTKQQLSSFFRSAGFKNEAIESAIMIGDQLPGKVSEILNSTDTDSIREITDYAKRIIAADQYDRLAIVGKLSKNTEQTIQTLQMIQRMSRLVIAKNANAKKWQSIAIAAYKAEQEIAVKVNAKLALSEFAISF